MMHTYFDIIADTAGFGGRTVHCPVWIIATVQPQLHRGFDVVWRHLHNIMKIPLYLKGGGGGGGGGFCFKFI